MKSINEEIYSRARSTAEVTAVVAGTLLLISAVLYFLYLTRAILLDFVIALVIAVALAPAIRYLEKHRFSRVWASAASLFVTVIILGAIVGAIATPLVTQGIKLIQNAPGLINQLSTNSNFAGVLQKYHITDELTRLSAQSSANIAGSGSSAIVFAGTVFGGITTFVITIIFAFFILVDGPRAWKRLLNLFEIKNAARIDSVGHKILTSITGFVSGNLLISLIAGSVTLVLLLILKVPYAFALAALVALLDLIPLVGATLGTIVVGLVALVNGLAVALIAVIVLITYQFLENHFIQPVVYSRSVALSALVIIVATVAGAELMGLIGALLAIPAASVIQIIIVEVFARNEAV